MLPPNFKIKESSSVLLVPEYKWTVNPTGFQNKSLKQRFIRNYSIFVVVFD